MTDTVAPHQITPSRASRVVAAIMLRTVRAGGSILPATRAGARAGRVGMQFLRVCMPSWGVVHHKVSGRVDGARVVGEWVNAIPAPGTPVVYYLHGSAYFSCSPGTHRGLVSRVGAACDRPVFALRYRLAPEHPFPAAHDDAVNGYRWLLAQGFRPQDIVLAGDSAGGHLALGLVGELSRRGFPMPASMVLFSPIVDPTIALAATREPQLKDPYTSAATARRLIGMYIADADPADPRLDVIQGVGSELPPMLIQTGGLEILAADAERFAAAQRAAGGRCELQIWQGQVHVFQGGYRAVPEAVAALRHVRDFVVAMDAEQA
ncbi:alpha/beta hydrolase fold domain-containing protein [Rhodococcus sp. NPDC058514]|uniref:alpha/beta hydrolase fold domain-containing protein n=1 Tax=unclassified Rhodococcus (in: high G+C Gram-positive bacteria) TaxID=192944 RepID=UPI003656F6C4